MRVLIKMGCFKLAAVVEESLAELKYSFVKNQGNLVTEFEVRDPCHLLVTVEDLAREHFSLWFRSPFKVESALEIRRTVGSHDPEPETQRCRSALVQALRSRLPEEPWKGLGIYGSRRQKTYWEKLEGPE